MTKKITEAFVPVFKFFESMISENDVVISLKDDSDYLNKYS